MKYVAAGVPITEFVVFRSKMYSYMKDNGVVVRLLRTSRIQS